MPNQYLLRSHAKIVLNRLIDNNDRNTLLTLNEFFANKNMDAAISRIELITIMHSIYEAHQVSLDLRIIRGTVTQYDTSPTTYDGDILFSLNGDVYDIGWGTRAQPDYDTSMTVVYKDHTLDGTLSQYASYINVWDQMKISLPKWSHNLYDCKECQITLIKQ